MSSERPKNPSERPASPEEKLHADFLDKKVILLPDDYQERLRRSGESIEMLTKIQAQLDDEIQWELDHVKDLQEHPSERSWLSGNAVAQLKEKVDAHEQYIGKLNFVRELTDDVLESFHQVDDPETHLSFLRTYEEKLASLLQDLHQLQSIDQEAYNHLQPEKSKQLLVVSNLINRMSSEET